MGAAPGPGRPVADEPFVVLFQGDSITDAGRATDPAGIGSGYVRDVAEGLARVWGPDGVTVLNRGVSGDCVADLRARWSTDAIELRPHLVSILVGVNDTWRRYDGAGRVTSAEAYEADLRHLVQRTTMETGARVVLVEPFLVPVSPEQWAWREDLDPRIQAVRRTAADLGALLVAADGVVNQLANRVGAARVADDGVHPTRLGHEVLARAWLDAVLPLSGEGARPPAPRNVSSTA